MVLARTLHFAATISASGAVFFCNFIASEPPGATARYREPQHGNVLYDQLALIFWLSLTLAIASGIAWFALVVGDIGDRPATQFFANDLAWSVATGTQFGRIWVVHLFLGVLSSPAPLGCKGLRLNQADIGSPKLHWPPHFLPAWHGRDTPPLAPGSSATFILLATSFTLGRRRLGWKSSAVRDAITDLAP